MTQKLGNDFLNRFRLKFPRQGNDRVGEDSILICLKDFAAFKMTGIVTAPMKSV